MAFGLYGKHPGRGDFLQAGLPEGLAPPLEGWLDTALTGARAALGPGWETVWDGNGNGGGLRFWIGEAIWGRALCGVLVPSRDRVGRRFPLVLLWSDADPAALPPPPAIDPDQHWYADLAARLLAMRDGPGPAPGEGAAALIAGLAPPAPPGWAPAPGPAGFWAERMADAAPQPDPAATEPVFAPDPEPEPEPDGDAEAAGAEPDSAGTEPVSAGTDPGPAGTGPETWALPEPDPEPAAATPSGAAAALMADIALADHRRAAAGRSYFWTEAEARQPARVHAGPGLPGGAVLAWLMGGTA